MDTRPTLIFFFCKSKIWERPEDEATEHEPLVWLELASQSIHGSGRCSCGSSFGLWFCLSCTQYIVVWSVHSPSARLAPVPYYYIVIPVLLVVYNVCVHVCMYIVKVSVVSLLFVSAALRDLLNLVHVRRVLMCVSRTCTCLPAWENGVGGGGRKGSKKGELWSSIKNFLKL